MPLTILCLEQRFRSSFGFWNLHSVGCLNRCIWSSFGKISTGSNKANRNIGFTVTLGGKTTVGVLPVTGSQITFSTIPGAPAAKCENVNFCEGFSLMLTVSVLATPLSLSAAHLVSPAL